MLISHKWLKKYLPTLDELTKAQIAESLTTKLAEVEQIIAIRREIDKIIVGEVLEVNKIEESKKLTYCKVRVSDNTINDIICGAPNVKKGLKVAVCMPGGRIYDAHDEGKTIEITQKTMFGITSNGMICSAKELGISNDHEGIMELEDQLVPGTNLDEILKDFVYEIENKSLSHRPDCFSHEGIAREISAILNIPFKQDEINQPIVPTSELPFDLSVKVDNKDCERFSLAILSDIKVNKSPLWLICLLTATGLRSVNNIVDAANYIMFDKGQPLHTYDYDKITSKKLIVRYAKNGEKMKAIDGKEYRLEDDMMVISNGNQVDDIAGIMGGLSSEISFETKNILIEAANFNMYSVRRTSRKLGIRSEASTRFEKGQNPEKTENSIKQALNLILDLAEGEIAHELIDYYPNPREQKVIELDLTLVKRILGIDLPVREIIDYLERINCEILDPERVPNISSTPESNLPISVKIPKFRGDLNIEQDLLEEIARLYGYDKLTPTLPERDLQAVIPNKGLQINRLIGEIMASEGFDEIYSYTFIGKQLLERLSLNSKDNVKLINPLSPELELLRTSLIPNLIDKALLNASNYDEFSIYEKGRVIFKDIDPETKLNIQPENIAALSFSKEHKLLFYQIKTSLMSLAEGLNINLKFSKTIRGRFENLKNIFHPGRSAGIYLNEEIIGVISELHPKIKMDLNIKGNIAYWELDLSAISKLATFSKEYSPISIYQKVKRDLSFFIPDNAIYSDIENSINSLNLEYLIGIEFKDMYKEEGNKSITISLKFQSLEKTLTDTEINDQMDKIVKVLEEKIKAKVRNN
ncbi:MAG TPA: phenylalanine--tRNA ligase subunit beta [Candidatus Dojkabacteria bacterium]|nr:phenylalanine--tRNA ligase subunit beta [Candidatus Dojkabacteria bacterium]